MSMRPRLMVRTEADSAWCIGSTARLSWGAGW